MEHIVMLQMIENACGHPRRFETEDVSRIFGWGPAPGVGLCDYPGYCELGLAGTCPLLPQPDGLLPRSVDKSVE